MLIRLPLFALIVLGLLAPTGGAYGQSAAEMLEQARSRARDMEEMKKVLNGPDQNMRLATFDIMINSDDEAMREVAIDAGLASTDAVMQAMAFKEAILSLKRLILNLEIDPNQAEKTNKAAENYVASNGNTFVIDIAKVDKKAGTFTLRANHEGAVNGTLMNFRYGYNTGSLALQDDATVKGTVTTYATGGYGKFIASARIR
jgi:hypothetical protein